MRVLLPKRSLSILELSGIKSVRTRVVGLSYWIPDSARGSYAVNEYLLVREPENEWDVNAVAVYGKGRKIGHLSAAKAAALAPIFDALDYDAFKVGGASVSQNSSSLWVDLPALPALRAFVKSAELQQDAAGSGVPADK
ncbi:HIRAN domain-containing protein [Arthrobacter sp. UNCCL28]|nr:HIRAN domain-containing protein [Arthrobacter sp. UNCCL28]